MWVTDELRRSIRAMIDRGLKFQQPLRTDYSPESAESGASNVSVFSGPDAALAQLSGLLASSCVHEQFRQRQTQRRGDCV